MSEGTTTLRSLTVAIGRGLRVILFVFGLVTSFHDRTPITGTGYTSCIEQNGQHFVKQCSDNPIDPTTLNTGGADYYPIRVVGDNGRMAYIGPIWVEVV